MLEMKRNTIFYLLYKCPGAEAKDFMILFQVFNEEKHFGHAAPLLAAHFTTSAQDVLREAARDRPFRPLLGSRRPKGGLAGAPRGTSGNRNGPGAPRTWSGQRSRHRKWLQALTGRGGAMGVSHSTRSVLQRQFVFFLPGCSGERPAAEISPFPSVAEPPKSSRRCSRVRASRFCPSRPRCVGPHLGFLVLLPSGRTAPRQSRGARSGQGRTSSLGGTARESPAGAGGLGFPRHSV